MDRYAIQIDHSDFEEGSLLKIIYMLLNIALLAIIVE
jgi:hypothetical protein